ncbi:MAG: hypothetical protein HQ557_16805 [Bacteroidetes bacterium]|nr:hypothetical protein [Bacteroidota bacterium]
MTKSTSYTAGRDINELVAVGLLVKSEAGGRSTSYELTTDLWDLLDRCISLSIPVHISHQLNSD